MALEDNVIAFGKVFFTNSLKIIAFGAIYLLLRYYRLGLEEKKNRSDQRK